MKKKTLPSVGLVLALLMVVSSISFAFTSVKVKSISLRPSLTVNCRADGCRITGECYKQGCYMVVQRQQDR